MTKLDQGPGFLRAQFWGMSGDDAQRVKRTLLKYPFLVKLARTKAIYHYTTSDALVGIVRDRGFWLSHHAYMNDAAEYTHGLDIVLDILRTLAKKPRWDKFKQVLGSTISEMEAAPTTDYYVACFTEEADSLEQWRAYCPNGGVNIELNTAAHGGYLGVGPRMLFNRVLYDDSSKKKIAIILSRRYFQEYIKDLENNCIWCSPDLHHEWVHSLSSALRFRIPAFKHMAFRSENEVRLIISGEEEKYFSAVHSRVRNGKIIPYIKSSEWSEALPPPKDRATQVPPLSISSVIIGPQSERELVARSVQDFMRRNGYPDINIRFSSAPYRTV